MTVIGDDGLPALNEAKYLKVDELLNDAYDYIHDRKGNPDQYLPLFREKVQERLINANYKGVLDEELLRIRVQRFIHAHLDKKFFSEEKEEIKEFFTMHYDENTKSITTINRAIDSLDYLILLTLTKNVQGHHQNEILDTGCSLTYEQIISGGTLCHFLSTSYKLAETAPGNSLLSHTSFL